jgi:hypothetical protein
VFSENGVNGVLAVTSTILDHALNRCEDSPKGASKAPFILKRAKFEGPKGPFIFAPSEVMA